MLNTLTSGSSEKGDLHQENQENRQQVVWGGAVLLTASIVGNGVSYLFGMYLARMMGVELFGTYALGLTIFNALVTISLFGLHTGAIKFVSHYVTLEDPHKLKSIIGMAMILTLGSALASAMGLLLVAPWLSFSVYRNPLLSDVLWWLALGVPLAALSTVMLSILQAFHVVRYTIMTKYCWEPIGKFGVVALLLWLGFGLTGVVSGLVLVFTVSVVIALSGITRIADMTPRGFLSLRPSTDSTRALISFCLPLTLANFFGVVAPRFDILFLGYWGTAQDVAIYAAAFQTSATLALVLGAFDRTFAPSIGRAFANQDQHELKEQFRLYTRMSFTMSIPLFIMLSIFSQEILSLFGDEFLNGSICLILLAFSQLFCSAMGTSSTLLLMGGHSRLVLTNTLAHGGFMIVFAMSCIPQWGILGAAVAGVASNVIINGVRVYQVWRLHTIHPFAWNLVKPIGAGVLTGGVVLSLKVFLGSAFTPILMVMGGILFVGLLWGFKLESSDHLLVLNALTKLRQLVKTKYGNVLESGC